MRAFLYDNYGSVDELYQAEVDDPAVGDDEILIKNEFISLNPYEWHFLGPTMFFLRFIAGLRKPKNSHKILRADVSGTVQSMGKNVRDFNIGDRVFGRSELNGYSSLVSVDQKRICHIPDGVSFEDSAAIPLAGVTAIQAVRDHARIQKGDKVLVNGASGGIGTLVIQFCKYYAAEVTGVCSTKNLELVKSLGADHVIDYTKESVMDHKNEYDKVIDNVGNLFIKEYNTILKEEGTATVLGFTSMKNIFGSMIFGGKKVKTMDAEMNRNDLEFMI